MPIFDGLTNNRIMSKSLFIILFIGLLGFAAQAQQSLLRYPAIDPSGENIAFSFQGDIWIMNLSNHIPIRLSIHPAYDSNPHWSPDGKMIAFSSKRYGSEDVFVMNADGSGLKRLTYHPSNDKVVSWNTKDRIVFETRRIDAQIERNQELFFVSPKGGEAQALFEALGSDAIESPDGKKVAFVRGSCRITRQAYQGSANRDIWLYDKEKKSYTQLTTDDYNQFQPQWKNNDELLFISSNGSHIYQLMSLSIKQDKAEIQAKPYTKFKDFGLRYYQYSAKSKLAILESGKQVFLLNTESKKLTPIDIQIDMEGRKNNMEHKTYKGAVNSFQVSPNGKYLASAIHGNIYITQAKDKDNFTKTLTNDSYNNSKPVWLNDSAILFISDRKGQKDIYLIQSADKEQSNLFKSLKLNTTNISKTPEDEQEIVLSNKRDQLAYLSGHIKLMVAHIDKNGNLSQKKEMLNTWDTPSDVCWSPDDKYLAYTLSDLDFNSEIYIQPVDKSLEPVNVSMHPRSDGQASWSPDGKKLVFTSIRNHGNYDIWYVWLQKKDWQKTMDEWKQEDDEDADKKDEDIEVIIDFDQIHQRLYQLTSLPGDENRPIFSKDGKSIYFNSNSNKKGKTDLYKISWDRKDIKEITKGGQAGRAMQLSADGKYIYLLKKGSKTARLKLSNDKIENIAINAQADINHQELNEQVFADAWEIINNGFYDPNFHGRDWEKLGKQYQPIILSASTDKDFQDIFNWMLGELNASHMGYRGPTDNTGTKDKTGLLGIDYQAQDNGLLITKVLVNSPADKEESQLLKGDIITQIDGTGLNKNTNLYQLLQNKVNQAVVLQINRNGSNKEVIIRPTSSLNNQKYEDWVHFNRKLVDEYSNNKLGYLHIKAMGWTSFEQFERDIMAAGYGKEGILIDVRFNGGGWTTDYLMAVLSVKQHAYTIPRGATDNLEKNHLQFREHYAFGERLPFASWTKPSIALCNQNSYSNAEIFSHAYQGNGLGTLVGTPTFGAVISTSGRGLMNGGYIRLPFRAWYAKATDKNMELNPAVPDVIVDILPDSRAKGKDEQLQEAVKILLQQIEK